MICRPVKFGLIWHVFLCQFVICYTWSCDKLNIVKYGRVIFGKYDKYSCGNWNIILSRRAKIVIIWQVIVWYLKEYVLWSCGKSKNVRVYRLIIGINNMWSWDKCHNVTCGRFAIEKCDMWSCGNCENETYDRVKIEKLSHVLVWQVWNCDTWSCGNS